MATRTHGSSSNIPDLQRRPFLISGSLHFMSCRAGRWSLRDCAGLSGAGIGGGFVFTQVHNIQPDVPPENVAAMVDAFRKFRTAR